MNTFKILHQVIHARLEQVQVQTKEEYYQIRRW